MSADTVCYLLPEIVLIAVATAIYLGGAFFSGRKAWTPLAVAGLLAAAALLARQAPASAAGLGGALSGDHLAAYVRWLALLMGLLLVLLTARETSPACATDYLGSLLLAVVGLMLVAAADDLVLLFLGLELISIPTYVLLYLGRQGLAAQEASAKYFFLSILSSALMLYGFSFLYGIAGSTQLERIHAALAEQTTATGGFARLAQIAAVLAFAGLGFKIAAVPFQFYAPDVYEGTSHGNAALLSVLPKAAGFVALVRLVGLAMPGHESTAWRLAMIMGALTMTLGNLLALWQDNLRRLMAYSSIAHAGYMLVGLAAGFAVAPIDKLAALDGFSALLFYLSVYVVATIGVFAVLAYLGRRGQPIDNVDELAGLGKAYPLMGATLAVCLFSLAGIPPLAGFWGKLTIFYGALNVSAAQGDHTLRAWFLALAVLGVLNAAVAASYYLRLIGVLFFRSPRATTGAEGGLGAWGAAVLAAGLVVAVGLFPRGLLQASSDAIRSARRPTTSAATARGKPQRGDAITPSVGSLAGADELAETIVAPPASSDQPR